MNNLNQINTNTFSKYYSVRFSRKDVGNDIPLVAVEKEIPSSIGTRKVIKKQNKGTFLGEVLSENQEKTVVKIRKLDGLELQVTEHKVLNECQLRNFSQ